MGLIVADGSMMRKAAMKPCFSNPVEWRTVRPFYQPAKCNAVASSSTGTASEPSNSAPAFVNRQKFLVSDEAVELFETAWDERVSYMKTRPGFMDVNIVRSGSDFSIESSWGSVSEWEAFNCSKEARRHHLPSGIYQYVPKAGEGFPEDFVPFIDMNTHVTAKYPKGVGKKAK